MFGDWLMVDLGKDATHFIDNVTVKNRADCCGGRLRRFYVEVLDAAKNVVFSEYHSGSVGNAGVRVFTVNNGTGRFVRVRYEDALKDYLHIAELEGMILELNEDSSRHIDRCLTTTSFILVWGYPIEVPANPPGM